MLMKFSIILFSNSHNYAYNAHLLVIPIIPNTILTGWLEMVFANPVTIN